jgi:hypothetical protein
MRFNLHDLGKRCACPTTTSNRKVEDGLHGRPNRVIWFYVQKDRMGSEIDRRLAQARPYSFFGSSSSSITRLSKRPAPPPSMLP